VPAVGPTLIWNHHETVFRFEAEVAQPAVRPKQWSLELCLDIEQQFEIAEGHRGSFPPKTTVRDEVYCAGNTDICVVILVLSPMAPIQKAKDDSFV
jgi:hypothetical protein